MTSRRRLAVLELSGPADPALVSALETDRWALERADDPAPWEGGLGQDRPPIGLALLERVDDALADRLRRTRMDWIAVVPRHALTEPRTARLIAATFHDFHTTPVDVARLLVVLGHAHGRAALLRAPCPDGGEATGRFGMIGCSAPMLALYRTLEKVARSDMPVLVQGESGTGKELAARAIHQHSSRASGPFVPVNCGAIPVNLVQAELFGHERGAFTGAHQRRIGSIESAAGGVVFLDEIGDLPLESQASLLRFLQDRSIVRVGASRPVSVDARVIAATHVNLGEAVRRGRFREDLFYRLNVLHAEMPALRERGADIALIAQRVLRDSAPPQGRAVTFSPRALQAMARHAWPGNVRELINRVQKAVVMCEGPCIGPEDLGLHALQAAGASLLDTLRTAGQRELVLRALDGNRYNMAATARELGVSRVTLYRLLRRLDIGRRGAAAGYRGGDLEQ